MKLELSITREELNAITEVYTSYDVLLKVFAIDLGIADQLKLIAGLELKEPIGDIGYIKISKKGIKILIEDDLVPALNLYADIIRDIADIAVPTVVAIKKLIIKYS